MDYFVTRTGDKSAPYVNEFVVNDENGKNAIPVNTCNPGSTCVVISTGNAYMLDLDRNWQPL